MEKLLLLRSKITRWFTSENHSLWRTVFFIITVLLAGFVSFYFSYDPLIFWTAVITSVVIALSLFGPCSFAQNDLESFRVSLAWGCVNYSLFVTISSLLLQKTEWGNSHFLGFLVAFIISAILIVICSYLSYLLKLEDISVFSASGSKFNNCRTYMILSFLFIMCIGFNNIEDSNKYREKQKIEQQNILFDKEEWYTVREWHTEILNGNTIYVIKTAKGRIGIYPSKYPKIRDVNNKTKIKYLAGDKKDGLTFPIKLEIKN